MSAFQYEATHVYYCVAHDAMETADDDCCLESAPEYSRDDPCDWRRCFIDRRPEARVEPS